MEGGAVRWRQVVGCLVALAVVTLATSGALAASARAAFHAPASPRATTTSPCALADGLYDAGSISAARVAPGSECASRGLTQIGELVHLCDLGRSEQLVHLKGDALEAYKSALAKDPNAECAIAGVRSASPDGFTRALQWISTAVPNIPTVLAGLGMLVVGAFLVLVALGRISYRGRRLPLDRFPGLRTLL
jgi:hypothetical protein